MSDTSAAEDGGPFEEQRRIYKLMSQETRHLILQYVLGHPAHLLSLDELAYLIPKNKASIRDQLQTLADARIIDRYEHPPSESSRDLPSQFYGLTEYGVKVLHEYNYLRGLPVARAVYDNTRLSEKAKRHRDAPRPTLPAAVQDALTIDEPDDSGDFERLARYVRERSDAAHGIEDQIEVAKAFHETDIGPAHDGIKRPELLERLDVDIDYQPQTVLQQLVRIGVLEETEPSGPDIFAISERIDDLVNGCITEEAERNIDALIAHVDDELQSVELEDEAAELDDQRAAPSTPSIALADGAGRTIRSILATEFDISPERVVDHLRSGDPVDRLNTAVNAIESSEEVSRSEEYGRIVFLRQAHRYRLTEKATDLL